MYVYKHTKIIHKKNKVKVLVSSLVKNLCESNFLFSTILFCRQLIAMAEDHGLDQRYLCFGLDFFLSIELARLGPKRIAQLQNMGSMEQMDQAPSLKWLTKIHITKNGFLIGKILCELIRCLHSTCLLIFVENLTFYRENLPFMQGDSNLDVRKQIFG